MKKVSVKTAVKKFIAVTAAALMLGSGMAFVSCSSDDGSDNDITQGVHPENPNPSNPENPSNPALEAASAPAAGSVTSTATTSAENNDGTLVVDTEKEARALEYKLGDGNWTSFVENKATGLAGGTYTIRVKASETYNASTETISVIVKKFTAAPASADFTVTLASSDTAVDATITAKSADVVANLMIVGASAEGADASWSEIAGSETPLTVKVKAGTYKAYYAETETSVKSAESEIVVGVKVIFSEFVADGLKDADSKDYEALTSKDGLVTTGVRSKYQNNVWSTYDYNAETGTGYTYTARVKVNKASGDAKGTLTINNVAVGSVLRIDGGNANGKDVRAVSFKGTDSDSTNWEASAMGSFYVTASAETVVLTSETNEFCIYGIHVVNEKVAATVAKSEKNYGKPVIALSEISVVKDAVVTVTETIPDVISKDYYSDGKVNSSTEVLSLSLTYKVAPVTAEGVGEYTDATVTDGKITASEAGKFSYTASYTIGEGEEATTYTSEPVTLEVSAGFNPTEKEIENSNEILGLTATSVSSNNEEVAKAELKEGKIVITSVAQGNALITFGDGTNSGSINVTVNAGGEITATVKMYSSVTTDSWTITEDVYATIKAATENYDLKGASDVLTATFYKSGAKGHGMVTTSNKVSYGGYGSWAAAPAISGGKVKNDFLKITGVKGAAKLTVKWAMNSAQTAGSRSLEVTIGNDKTKCVAVPCNDKKGEQDAYVVSFDAGSGTDVYIGASNEIALISVSVSAQ